MSCPFHDMDDSDMIDTSDVLPFTQLVSSLNGGDTTAARKPRERGRPLGSMKEK
jgi:hypothetical protein